MTALPIVPPRSAGLDPDRLEWACSLLQRWVDAAQRGTIDGPGAWDGYAAVAVCEAGVQAVNTGGKIPVRLGARPEPTGGITAPDLEGARP